MAILWQKTIQNTLYEVRGAGQTRRLYTDGVFHSQYNSTRAISGGIWDLLTLPALFYPAESIQRVLILGVGGGAAIHQLQAYVKPHEIIGVELNPIHIKLAKRFFGITKKAATLIEADAVSWLENYRGEPFDLIIDDVFTELDGEPLRVVKANKQWFETLNNNLTDDGMLVMNFTSRGDLKNCAALSYKKVNKLYSNIYQFSIADYDNVIAAFLKKSATTKEIRHHIASISELKNINKIKFNIKKLK